MGWRKTKTSPLKRVWLQKLAVGVLCVLLILHLNGCSLETNF